MELTVVTKENQAQVPIQQAVNYLPHFSKYHAFSRYVSMLTYIMTKLMFSALGEWRKNLPQLRLTKKGKINNAYRFLLILTYIHMPYVKSFSTIASVVK